MMRWIREWLREDWWFLLGMLAIVLTLIYVE
jgi:hypothetical protein